MRSIVRTALTVVTLAAPGIPVAAACAQLPEVFVPAGPDSLPVDSLRPGMRLVIGARNLGPFRAGVVTGIPARDTIIFDFERSRRLVRLPLREVHYMAVSTGRAPAGGRTMRGVALGAAAGFAVGFLADRIERGGEECLGGSGYASCGNLAATPTLLGATFGAFGGAILGSRLRGEQGRYLWRPVRLSDR